MSHTLIFTGYVQTVLKLMEGSTATLYWAAELQRQTDLSKPTVQWALDRLSEAGYVHKSTEKEAFLNHPTRTFCELTPFALAALRLMPPST
jgi:DNA-binding MarR family transcriptional regulator